MNGPAWRPQVQKLHIYEGIFNLNRAFHATLLSLERLENLGFFRSEYLNACKIELEHTRANANDELIETLRDYEQDEGGRFYRMQKEWEDQLKDPDDVFLAAKSRKEEMREQMRDLQRGLDRMKPKKKKARSVRKRKHPGSDRYAAAESLQRPFCHCDRCIYPATSRHAYSAVPSITGVEAGNCDPVSGSVPLVFSIQSLVLLLPPVPIRLFSSCARISSCLVFSGEVETPNSSASLQLAY